MLQRCPHDAGGTERFVARTLPVDKAFSICNVSREAGLLTSDKFSFLSVRNLPVLSRGPEPEHWPLLLFRRTYVTRNPYMRNEREILLQNSIFRCKRTLSPLCTCSNKFAISLYRHPASRQQNTPNFKAVMSQQQHYRTNSQPDKREITFLKEDTYPLKRSKLERQRT